MVIFTAKKILTGENSLLLLLKKIYIEPHLTISVDTVFLQRNTENNFGESLSNPSSPSKLKVFAITGSASWLFLDLIPFSKERKV